MAVALLAGGCSAAESAPVLLDVGGVDLEPSLAGVAGLQDGREAIVLDVSIMNVSNGQTLLAAPLFSVETDSGVEILGAVLTDLLEGGCRADASVPKGRETFCSLVFEMPENTLPLVLNYQLEGGGQVSTDIEICQPETTLCGRSCHDLNSDEQHCGACRNEVPSGGICEDGVPRCISEFGAACDGQCVDLRTDGQHCGGCDSPVPQWGHCEDGVATCTQEGRVACDGVCVDLSSDVGNCGSCGVSTDGVDCVDGVPGCVAGQHRCDGACVSISDPDHCGECGVSVSDIDNDAAACLNGALTCPADVPDLCSTTCVNLDTDTTNCGECGLECPGSGECDGAGNCVLDQTTDGSGSCNDFCENRGYVCFAAARVCTVTTEVSCDETFTNQSCQRRCVCTL
ncbi:MAG: hypothetical protein ACRBN8_02125 [Nannocystales bacterium]